MSDKILQFIQVFVGLYFIIWLFRRDRRRINKLEAQVLELRMIVKAEKFLEEEAKK